MACIEALACPHCGGDLVECGSAVRCDAGHSFDVARQGYVNLLAPGSHTGTADTAEMVAARADFFAAGHFAPLIAKTASAVAAAAAGTDGCIVDAGAGTGEYLSAALAMMPGRAGIALDVSKFACRRAARARGVTAVVCDAWGRLPLKGSAAAVVMSVFAPRNAAEFSRVLAPGGALVVVTPNPDHLDSLVEDLGLITVEPGKDERLGTQLGPHFSRVGAERFGRDLTLSRHEAAALAAMGPSARHVTSGELVRRLAAMSEPVHTRLSVTISTWRNEKGAE